MLLNNQNLLPKKTIEQWSYWVQPSCIILTLLSIFSFVYHQITHFSGVALFIYLVFSACLSIGLALSLVLAQHSIGNTTGTFSKYCSRNSNASCHAILDSPNAQFLGVSYADIGIAYFSGALLLFFISLLAVDAFPVTQSINTPIIYLSFLALPYSGYSLYLQKFRLKSWCPLCLYTQAIVILQALLIFIFIGFSHHTTHYYFSLSLSLTLLCFPGLIWFFLRKQLIGKAIQKEQQIQTEAIISSEENIETILQKQQQRLNNNDLEEDETLESDLIISSHKKLEHDNSHALQITIGLSPSCQHCRDLLEEVYQFLQHNDSAIECRIRLLISEGDTQEAISDKLIAEHITSFILNENEGAAIAIKALRNWYQECRTENIKQWLTSVRNINESESIDVSPLLADTSFWANQKNITMMPAMYIEDIHIPFISEEYSTILLRKIIIADIKNLT